MTKKYYQETVTASNVSSAATRLSAMGYTIFNILPQICQNDTKYIIIYF